MKKCQVKNPVWYLQPSESWTQQSRDTSVYFTLYKGKEDGWWWLVKYLDSVAGLGRDALHGEDDLEGVLGDVPGAHGVQRRLLVDLVAHHHRPEHLEEVLRAVHLHSELHRYQMIRNLL